MGSRLKPTDSGRQAGACPPGVLWLDTALHQVSSMFDDQEDARMSTDFRLESFKKLECVWFLNGGLRRAAALQGWGPKAQENLDRRGGQWDRSIFMQGLSQVSSAAHTA